MDAATEGSGPVRFEDRDLRRSRFRTVDLRGAWFHNVSLTGAVLRGVDMVDVTIDGDVDNLVINGVDVAPLIEAELDRRQPDRPRMRPSDPDGFREAWDILERLWDDTVTRARHLDPDLLHESVDDEWSFIQTLRHLVFATDSWLLRAVLGDPSPWHPLALPHDEMQADPAVPWDRVARLSLDDVMEVRRDRQTSMRRFLDTLDQAQLDADTEPVDAPGWPPSDSFPVRKCLLIILNEEWQHHLYAERDLTVLEERGGLDD